MEEKLTEVMTLPLPETDSGTLSADAYDSIIDFAKKQDMLLIGPGLSINKSTQELIRKMVVNIDIPMVLDADALNSLKGFTEMLAKIKSFGIITPHPQEFSRVFGVEVSELQQDRKKFAVEQSLKNRVTIVLKGHASIVAEGGNVYENTTGNPGMAVGGSGDVLAGIISAFVAQGIKAFEAAKFGVYIHGLAADIAAKDKTEIALIPTDIIDYLPEAFKSCGL